METSWFGIPGATRKVNKLSDMYQKSLVSHMKVLLRWTCWAGTFDYSIGSRGVSDNCTALALLKGGVVISAMYNTFIHFSAVPDLHHDTQPALIIPCVLARR